MPGPIDVYLLLGESNLAGHAPSDHLPDPLRPPHPTAKLWWTDLESPGDNTPHPRNPQAQAPPARTWSPLAPGAGAHPHAFGPELSFGHTLAARSEHPVALIKAAKADAALFAHWRPDQPSVATTLTAAALQAANTALQQLRNDGHQPAPAGIAFFQGHADARDANPDPRRHPELLAALLGRLRLEWAHQPELPAVILGLSPRDHHPAPHAHKLKQAAAELAQRTPALGWIDLDDLNPHDGLHLGAPDTLAAGDRAAFTLLSLQRLQTQTPESARTNSAAGGTGVSPVMDENPDPAPTEANSALAPGSARGSQPDKPAAPTATTPPRSDAAPPRSAPTPTDLPQPPAAPRVIALMNQKGGVGKTTTAVSVGAALASTAGGNRRVLLVDLDPQAHLTLSIGVDPERLEYTLYDLLTDDDVAAAQVVQTVDGNPNLGVLPAETNLAGAEAELADRVATGMAQTILRNKTRDLIAQFDYVLIDCPPALGLLTVNALCLATEVVVPMQAHFLALQGLSKLLETVRMVGQSFNPDLAVGGAVICMHEAQTLLAGEVVDEVQTFFEQARGSGLPWQNAAVFQPPVRRNIKLAEAPSFGSPIHTYAPDSNGARDYLALAQAIDRHRPNQPETVPGAAPLERGETAAPTAKPATSPTAAANANSQ
ncbi:MAG: ParA family protein [Planctomycetota bacterium]